MWGTQIFSPQHFSSSGRSGEWSEKVGMEEGYLICFPFKISHHVPSKSYVSLLILTVTLSVYFIYPKHQSPSFPYIGGQIVVLSQFTIPNIFVSIFLCRLKALKLQWYIRVLWKACWSHPEGSSRSRKWQENTYV